MCHARIAAVRQPWHMACHGSLFALSSNAELGGCLGTDCLSAGTLALSPSMPLQCISLVALAFGDLNVIHQGVGHVAQVVRGTEQLVVILHVPFTH